MNDSAFDFLFPAPVRIEQLKGISIATPASFTLINQVRREFGECFSRGYSLTSATSSILPVMDASGMPLLLLPATDLSGESYRISILNDRVRVEASSTGGFQYAGTTFGQMVSQHPNRMPGVIIFDHPVYRRRGFMLDISRSKVPTMATLYELADKLALWKFNHLQLYTEHTFAYSRHPDIWRDASPITGEEIEKLDVYCRSLNIELAANQNSFGHLHRWLKHPAYRHLAESPDGYTTPWGEVRNGPFSLNPLDPASIDFVSGLYDELLPRFTSRYVNVGCDETFDLGQGASRSTCESIGKGRVYLNFIRKIKKLMDDRGKTMMFWGDIILHYPELIGELDRNMVAMVWGYESDHPFDEQCRAFAGSGIPYWVCPGTSNWNSITGRLENAHANINAAAHAGSKNGAEGFMLTEWGDNGHWQTMPFTQLAMAIGGAAAWHGHAPPFHELHHLFELAHIITGFGNAYLHAGFTTPNSSPLFPLIRFQDVSAALNKWSVDALTGTGAYIRQLRSEIPDRMGAEASSNIWRDEIMLGGAMLEHAIARGLWIKADKSRHEATELVDQIVWIKNEFERIWRLRNREGGLMESMEPLAMREQEYKGAK